MYKRSDIDIFSQGQVVENTRFCDIFFSVSIFKQTNNTNARTSSCVVHLNGRLFDDVLIWETRDMQGFKTKYQTPWSLIIVASRLDDLTNDMN